MDSIIILNGYPLSGKNSFVSFCKEHSEGNVEVHHISTVDPAKKALQILGWDGREDNKTNEVRDALSALKDISTEVFDGPFRSIRDRISQIQQQKKSKHSLIFIDSREPEEIQRFKETYSKSLAMCIIKEPEGILPKNHADRKVMNFEYDVLINNQGTLEELSEIALKFMQEVLP